MKKIINQEGMRLANLFEVLELIRKKKALTRKEVQEYTGLSWGGVSQIISRLMDLGYIVEKKSEASISAGRIPSYVSINREDNFAIGIDINYYGIYAVIINLCNEKIYEERLGADLSSKDALLNSIYSVLDGILEKYKDKHLLAIGVSMQGSVDVEEGVSLGIKSCRDWKNVPIKAILEERYGLFVCMAHDPDCILFAEAHENKKDTILLRIGDGIGMAVMKKKNLISASGMLELGHTLAPTEDEDINVENNSLDKVVSIKHFESEEEKIRFFSKMVHPLSVAITNSAILFDIKNILICGEIMQYKKFFFNALTETVKRQMKCEDVHIEEYDDKNAAYGVALIAASHRVGLDRT